MRHKIGQWDCNEGRAGEGKRVLECTLKIEQQKGEGVRRRSRERFLFFFLKEGGGDMRGILQNLQREQKKKRDPLEYVMCLKIILRKPR